MKRFYVVASIPLLLAALIPIAASLWVAYRHAKNDQLALIAEGVETQDQVHFLIVRGVRQAQGCKFARAIPPVELLAALRVAPPSNLE